MRSLLRASLATAALFAGLINFAEAATCSERLRTCHGYCVKSMGDAPNCHAKCGRLHDMCMSSGCWESKVVAKQCGFERQ